MRAWTTIGFLVVLAALAACRDDPTRAPPPAAVPIHIAITKVSPSAVDAGVLDIEIRNGTDKELGCYVIEVSYQGAGGEPLTMRINGRDRRTTVLSLSGGFAICQPHETCKTRMKSHNIPAAAVFATARALKVKAMNARRTGCEETPLIDEQMSP